jgi:hypothetical protein
VWQLLTVTLGLTVPNLILPFWRILALLGDSVAIVMFTFAFLHELTVSLGVWVKIYVLTAF